VFKYSIFQLFSILVAVIISASTLHAARPDRSPGIYIPEQKNADSTAFTNTRWVETTAGGSLEVAADANATWEALDQALSSFGIKALDKNNAKREWLTDWVVWKYDSKTGAARSKPGFGFGGRSLERHRFLFQVRPGQSPGHSVIVAQDSKREREVDLHPDSEYSWLEWKVREPQQQAADSFLKRLQLPVESALNTRFVGSADVTRTTSGDTVVVEDRADTSADVVLIRIPVPETEVATPATVVTQPVTQVLPDPLSGSESAGAPIQEQKSEAPAVILGGRQPEIATSQPPIQPAEVPPLGPVQQPEPSVTTREVPEAESPVKPAISQPPPIQPAEVPPLEPVLQPEPSVTTSEVPKAESPVKPAISQAVVQPTAKPRPEAVKPDVPDRSAPNGLLVRASPAVTWPALLKSLDDQEIIRDNEDGEQYLLTTDWIGANYDRKNQLLVMQSKEGPVWGFGLFGKGIERHRFQVVVLPANQGTRSIIYAYHTASQEQIDSTPDSSQTRLEWEDRDTSPDVALAFLRQLRIVIPH
ncbi:MAG: hypothetical protein HKM88_00510, partial [Halobacteria archaeon]|nr:hypothetical protein [Halobacteria archaeon]